MDVHNGEREVQPKVDKSGHGGGGDTHRITTYVDITIKEVRDDCTGEEKGTGF